ncbi:unnamed protein product [Anisakis simplex]|uniref:DUF4097 domain-containing protein n=1 Tax=Anisakis simplex TaxID=6269 RepID=A0A0M3JWQ5_ANISI|nr:unnamed protein product [Anisakis simplex]
MGVPARKVRSISLEHSVNFQSQNSDRQQFKRITIQVHSYNSNVTIDASTVHVISGESRIDLTEHSIDGHIWSMNSDVKFEPYGTIENLSLVDDVRILLNMLNANLSAKSNEMQVSVYYGKIYVELASDYRSLRLISPGHTVILKTVLSPFDIFVSSHEMWIRCVEDNTAIHARFDSPTVNVELQQYSQAFIERRDGQFTVGGSEFEGANQIQITSMQLKMILESDRINTVRAFANQSEIVIHTNSTKMTSTASHHVANIVDGSTDVRLITGNISIEISTNIQQVPLPTMNSLFTPPIDKFATVGPTHTNIVSVTSRSAEASSSQTVTDNQFVTATTPSYGISDCDNCIFTTNPPQNHSSETNAVSDNPYAGITLTVSELNTEVSSPGKTDGPSLIDYTSADTVTTMISNQSAISIPTMIQTDNVNDRDGSEQATSSKSITEAESLTTATNENIQIVHSTEQSNDLHQSTISTSEKVGLTNKQPITPSCNATSIDTVTTVQSSILSSEDFHSNQQSTEVAAVRYILNHSLEFDSAQGADAIGKNNVGTELAWKSYDDSSISNISSATYSGIEYADVEQASQSSSDDQLFELNLRVSRSVKLDNAQFHDDLSLALKDIIEKLLQKRNKRSAADSIQLPIKIPSQIRKRRRVVDLFSLEKRKSLS